MFTNANSEYLTYRNSNVWPVISFIVFYKYFLIEVRDLKAWVLSKKYFYVKMHKFNIIKRTDNIISRCLSFWTLTTNCLNIKIKFILPIYILYKKCKLYQEKISKFKITRMLNALQDNGIVITINATWLAID